MKLLQSAAGALCGLAVVAALAAVPDISAPAGAAATGGASSGAGGRAAASSVPSGTAWARVTARDAPAPTVVDSGPATDDASTPTRAAIARAVRASTHTAHVPGSAYSVRSIQLASGGRWGSAVIVPGDVDALDVAVVLVQRRGASWRVADLGTFAVGCGVAPRATIRELGLTCE